MAQVKSKNEILIETIVDVVPQWYIAEHAPNKYLLNSGDVEVEFCSQIALTPALTQIYDFMTYRLPMWTEEFPVIQTRSAQKRIGEEIAREWLKQHQPTVNWEKVLAYAEEVRYRTYENQAISLNLVVTEGNGKLDISDPNFQKLLDPLAGSSQTYFRVDKDMYLIDFCEVPWESVSDSKEYKFHPEFLHPIHSQLELNEVSVHITSRGDLIILNRLGLLCALRKGRWYIYDAPTFKNNINKAIGNYHVAATLFEVIFDLSYRRQGALLVYDPDHEVITKVVNRNSKLGTPESDPIRVALLRAMQGFGFSDLKNRSKKRLLLELASLDGAIIFDREHILAVGAMIETHPDAGATAGARTLASLSALLYGGHPVKISSDGDIAIPFYSKEWRGEGVSKAEITFS